ncbi:MAG TPA: MobF family relaxase [Candidatus Binataceae bacterium]|nr:MobF family relaxase [Candidatus Binataceae bacterium]
MLVMSKGALSAAQAETYYEEKYSQDDYYTEKRGVVGQWFGEGATALGLGGEVASEDFRAVLRGLRPSTGEVIVRNANGRSGRRAGWDATFNAPKSVSIQALGGGDVRLADAHRVAVTRALAELERYALSRQRGGSEWVEPKTSWRPGSTISPRGRPKAPMTAMVPIRTSTPTSSSPT